MQSGLPQKQCLRNTAACVIMRLWRALWAVWTHRGQRRQQLLLWERLERNPGCAWNYLFSLIVFTFSPHSSKNKLGAAPYSDAPLLMCWAASLCTFTGITGLTLGPWQDFLLCWGHLHEDISYEHNLPGYPWMLCVAHSKILMVWWACLQSLAWFTTSLRKIVGKEHKFFDLDYIWELTPVG